MEKEDEDYRHAELVELLLDRPDDENLPWARAVLLNTLEAHGHCHYRHDRLAGRALAAEAQESLREAFRLLEPSDRPLFLRLMLLVPWDSIRRETGLSLRALEVVRALSDMAGDEACADAARAVLDEGPMAVKRYPLGGVLLMERQPGRGIVLELGEAGRCFVAVDRVEAAVKGFRTYSWESNLRAVVSWWLGTFDEEGADKAVDFLLNRKDSVIGLDAERYGLMGLADWMEGNPSHARADEVVRRCLEDRNGAVRRCAASLASATGKTDVLMELVARDPDASVRRKAEKLLRAS